MSKPFTRPGTLAVVSSVNGLVVGVPAGNKDVIGRLATRDNANVISAVRTKQVITGEVSAADMTEVTADRQLEKPNLASDVADQISVEAIVAENLGDSQAELHEAKKPKSKRAARAQAAAAAAADSPADENDDIVSV